MIMALTGADEVRIAAREMRDVCFHEVGHVVVLHAFGGYGVARVWRNESPNVGEEKAWLGRTAIYAMPGQHEMADDARALLGVEPGPIPPNWKCLFALAGLVAEYLADGEREPWQIAEWIQSAIEFGEASATDIEGIGDDWAEDDVAEVIRLLLARWLQVEARVAELTAGSTFSIDRQTVDVHAR